jgi:Fic family protein
LLDEIDEFKAHMKPGISELAKTLVAEYAHQSVAIEDNPMKLGESVVIYDLLSHEVFSQVNLRSLPVEQLIRLSLPQYSSDCDASSVNELKNHIVISQWIAENAANCPGTTGLSQEQIKQLAAVTIRGTDSEKSHQISWGGRTELGDFRKTPIGVRSNPLAVFPYPDEIQSCIERFFAWRDSQHEAKELHPLVLACQMVVYFLHIHPFLDGNGRVSRMLMHDYLVRQGYLPIVYQDLVRADYTDMIQQAQGGDATAFTLSVLMTQRDELHSFYIRKP